MNVADLTGFYFLDTNIFVYSFDETAPHKQRLAQYLIQEALRSQRGVISSQVAQEFLNVALHKFTQPMNVSDARIYFASVLNPLCQHFPSSAFYEHALHIQATTGYSLYDTLIVTAALEAGCETLLSEDMQDGRVVNNLTILNPFVHLSLPPA